MPTRLEFPFRTWLERCVSVGGLSIEVSASTFMLFRCMCLGQRVSVLIKTKNIGNKKFDILLQSPLFTSLRKRSEIMDSRLQKCMQHAGANFKITLIGIIWALNLSKNCIKTPFALGDTVIIIVIDDQKDANFWFIYLFPISSTCFGRCFSPSPRAFDCVYSLCYSPPILLFIYLFIPNQLYMFRAMFSPITTSI